jgi:hypothetical protein
VHFEHHPCTTAFLVHGSASRTPPMHHYIDTMVPGWCSGVHVWRRGGA